MPEWVLFNTGNTKFALDQNCIKHICPVPQGLIQTQGRIKHQTVEDKDRTLLLLDLAAAAQHDATVMPPEGAEMIVMKKPHHFALLADNIEKTVIVNGEQMVELPPVFDRTARACFPKVLCLKENVALVVNADSLWGEFEAYVNRALADIHTLTSSVDDEKKHSPVVPGAPNEAAIIPVGNQTLEAYVDKKIQCFIELRVQEVVSKTVAQKLHRLLG